MKWDDVKKGQIATLKGEVRAKSDQVCIVLPDNQLIWTNARNITSVEDPPWVPKVGEKVRLGPDFGDHFAGTEWTVVAIHEKSVWIVADSRYATVDIGHLKSVL